MQDTIESIIETGRLHHYLAKLRKQDYANCQNQDDANCPNQDGTNAQEDRSASGDTQVGNDHVGQLACFTKGSQIRKPIGRGKCDNEDSDEEQEGMVCQMIGEQ